MSLNKKLSQLMDAVQFKEVPVEDGKVVNVSGGVWISAAGAYKIEGLTPEALADMKEAAEVELRKKIAAFLYGDIVLKLLAIHQGLQQPLPSKVADNIWVSAALKAILEEMGVSTEVQQVEKPSAEGQNHEE